MTEEQFLVRRGYDVHALVREAMAKHGGSYSPRDSAEAVGLFNSYLPLPTLKSIESWRAAEDNVIYNLQVSVRSAQSRIKVLDEFLGVNQEGTARVSTAALHEETQSPAALIDLLRKEEETLTGLYNTLRAHTLIREMLDVLLRKMGEPR